MLRRVPTGDPSNAAPLSAENSQRDAGAATHRQYAREVALPLKEPVKGGKKIREGNGGAVCVADDAFALRGKRCDGKGHGDAVVAVGVNFGAAQRSAGAPRRAASDAQAVGTLLHLRSHPTQVLGQRGDAVTLLYTQLLRIADLDAPLGVRSQRRQHWQLVDQLCHHRAGDYAAVKRAQLIDELPMLAAL